MLLAPDLDTFLVFPWGDQDNRICRLICDINTPDGRAVRRRSARHAEDGARESEGDGLHDERGDGSRVLPVQARRDGRGDDDDARRRRLLRPRAGGPRRGRAASDGGHARADGLRGRGGAPRSGARPARDRLPLRRRAEDGRQHRDVPLRGEARGDAVRAARVVHAEADLRAERQRHAHASVAVQGQGQRVLGREGRVGAVEDGAALHRRAAAARARHVRDHESAREFVQAARAGLRSAGERRVVDAQSLAAHSRSGSSRARHARRAADRPIRRRIRISRSR